MEIPKGLSRNERRLYKLEKEIEELWKEGKDFNTGLAYSMDFNDNERPIVMNYIDGFKQNIIEWENMLKEKGHIIANNATSNGLLTSNVIGGLVLGTIGYIFDQDLFLFGMSGMLTGTLIERILRPFGDFYQNKEFIRLVEPYKKRENSLRHNTLSDLEKLAQQ